MPSCNRLLRRWATCCQGVIPEDCRLELLPAFGGVPARQVRPRRRRLPAPHDARQGVMRSVEVFEHLVHGRQGHAPVGVLLGGALPGRQGGLVLRRSDRRLQAAVDGRGVGVVREEAALPVAGGGEHLRLPRHVEEAW